jgi:hypothetical protein
MFVGAGLHHVIAEIRSDLVEATFEAVAAGTFLYIAALDVVHDEFFHKRATWLDMGLFSGGLVVMQLLSLVE